MPSFTEGISWKGYYAFAMSYVGYFALYLARKPISTAKPYLKQEFEICSKLQLSVLDNAHLLPYSVVAMIFPNLVDRFGGMNMLTAAFGGAGAMVAAVYMTGFADIEYQFWLLCACLFLGGCFQAFAWPSAMKGMAEYIPPEPVKAIIPIWTTCCFLGSTLGGALMGRLYAVQLNTLHEAGLCEHKFNVTADPPYCDEHSRRKISYEGCDNKTVDNSLYFYKFNETDYSDKVDWRLTFLVPAGLVSLAAVVILFTKPKRDTSPPDAEGSGFVAGKEAAAANTEYIPMWRVVTEVPGCICMALAYACAKGSRYWYFYWAPDWLVESGGFDPSTAAYLSSALDIGSIVGLFLASFITTKSKLIRRPIPPLWMAGITSGLCVPIIFLARLMVKTESIYLTAASLSLLGLAVSMAEPVYSGMSSCEACDVDGRGLHGSVAGFINGVGSFGALVLNPLASWLGEKDYVYALATVATALTISTTLSFVAQRQLQAARRSRAMASNIEL